MYLTWLHFDYYIQVVNEERNEKVLMVTIGEVLRKERQRQGLTLKDVETGTNIRQVYLQAIEDGQFKLVPGEVYLKGFIRNYGNFLGIEGSELVKRYKELYAEDQIAVSRNFKIAPKADIGVETANQLPESDKKTIKTGKAVKGLKKLKKIATAVDMEKSPQRRPLTTKEIRERRRQKEGRWPEITIIGGVIVFIVLCIWLLF